MIPVVLLRGKGAGLRIAFFQKRFATAPYDFFSTKTRIIAWVALAVTQDAREQSKRISVEAGSVHALVVADLEVNGKGAI